MATISVEEFRESLAKGGAPGFDVRSAAEFAIDHIPGTTNIPMEQIESRMADIPPEPLVLVCEAGTRAQIVAGWLAGTRQATVLEGGMRSWRNAGLPTVACAPCRWALERQVRFLAGAIVLAGALLAILVNPKWVYLCLVIGGGLTFAGLTNICGMAMVLAKMPWNSQRKSAAAGFVADKANCCG